MLWALLKRWGELAHSVLKRKQGIRNTEDHDFLIRDAIGDITIYLAGFCSEHNINIQEAYDNKYTITFSSVVEISEKINDLLKHKDLFNVIHLLVCLIGFCQYKGINYEQTVMETWKDVVSKRDWVENPDCSMINLCDNCAHSDKSCSFDSGNNEIVVSECTSYKNIIVQSGIEKLIENSDMIILLKEE